MSEQEIQGLSPEEFFSQPYGERRLVSFASIPNEIDLETEKVEENSAFNYMFPWASKPVADISASILGGALAALFTPVGIPMVLGALAGGKAVKLFLDNEMKFAGTVVPLGWAEKLNLPPGHPQADSVYCAHPTIKEQYLPIANFHTKVFEDKTGEAISLLMYLGAKNIVATRLKGWDRKMAAAMNVGVPIEGVSAEFGVEGGKTDTQSDSYLFELKLRGHDKPELPEKLHWYPFEKNWENLVEGRLKFGLESFELKVESLSDFGVNGKLINKLEKAKLELGGEFSKHEKTIWSLKADF